jgi:hypothetical protein
MAENPYSQQPLPPSPPPPPVFVLIRFNRQKVKQHIATWQN